MSSNTQSVGRRELNATSKMSFIVAGFAFIAAGVGLLINHWMSGWMAVGGMAGVGLFYLAVGLLNLGSAEPIFAEDHDYAETAAHRLSGAANVDDQAIEGRNKTVESLHEERMANTRS